MKKEETWKCCLCGRKFTGWGNNAEPLKSGRCCNECNDTKVIPARLMALSNRK